MTTKRLPLILLSFVLICGAYALVNKYSHQETNRTPSAVVENTAQVTPPQVETEPEPAAQTVAEAQTPMPVKASSQVSPSRVTKPQIRSVETKLSEPSPQQVKSNEKIVFIDSPGPIDKVVENAPDINPIKQLFYLWVGGGINFLNLGQADGESNNFNFQSTPSSSYFIKTGGYVSKDLPGVEFSYKSSPGSIASSSTLTVTNSNYTWQTFATEALFMLREDPFVNSKLDKTVSLRFGFQQHFTPYLASQPSGSIDVRQNSVTNASVGAELILGAKHNIRYEFLARYQYPIASNASAGNTYSVKPKIAFDGSIGIATHLSKNTMLGAYWYGQWNQYNFSYYDNVNSTQNSGNQSLFYTNMEMRFGYVLIR